MRTLIIALLIASSAQVALAAGPVKVTIAWEYKDFPARIEIHEIKGEPPLWETASVKALDPRKIGEVIENSSFTMERDEIKRFALVAKNPSDKPLFFYAAPHAIHPVEHSLGFRFGCLCIHHAYNIQPGETWYRIVQLKLEKGFVGSDLTVTHPIIGIDEARAAEFPDTPPSDNKK